jgi:hypothetical protein
MAELTSWIRRGLSRLTSPARTCRPEVERLEDRLVPAVGGTSNQNYVQQLFLDLTGHPASAQSLASLSGELDRKGSHARVRVVLAVESSPEYRTAEIDQAYAQIAERDPQPTEVSDALHYMQQAGPLAIAGGQFLIGTGTIEQLKANLLASPQFFRRNGKNNTRFLRDAFADVLRFVPGRAALRPGQDDLAAGVSRFMVGLSLLDDPTTIQKEVQAFFPRYLRRPGDSTSLQRSLRFGLAHDGSHPHQGIDLVLAHLLATDEYFQLAQKDLTQQTSGPVTPTPTGTIPTTTTLVSVMPETMNGMPDNMLTFQASVSPVTSGGFSTDGGLVDVIDVNSGVTLGTGMLSSGTATIKMVLATEPANGDRLEAVYRGSDQFAGSTSAPRTFLVGDADDKTLGGTGDLPNDGDETAKLG